MAGKSFDETVENYIGRDFETEVTTLEDEINTLKEQIDAQTAAKEKIAQSRKRDKTKKEKTKTSKKDYEGNKRLDEIANNELAKSIKEKEQKEKDLENAKIGKENKSQIENLYWYKKRLDKEIERQEKIGTLEEDDQKLIRLDKELYVLSQEKEFILSSLNGKDQSEESKKAMDWKLQQLRKEESEVKNKSANGNIKKSEALNRLSEINREKQIIQNAYENTMPNYFEKTAMQDRLEKLDESIKVNNISTSKILKHKEQLQRKNSVKGNTPQDKIERFSAARDRCVMAIESLMDGKDWDYINEQLDKEGKEKATPENDKKDLEATQSIKVSEPTQKMARTKKADVDEEHKPTSWESFKEKHPRLKKAIEGITRIFKKDPAGLPEATRTADEEKTKTVDSKETKGDSEAEQFKKDIRVREPSILEMIAKKGAEQVARGTIQVSKNGKDIETVNATRRGFEGAFSELLKEGREATEKKSKDTSKAELKKQNAHDASKQIIEAMKSQREER